MALPSPKVLRNEQNIQHRYELPHRIHCTAYHPSNAIVYGHENGVRIITRHPSNAPSRLDFNFGQTTQLAVLATQHVVFAAACVDAVRLVALPNTIITLSAAANAVAITLQDKTILVAAHSPNVTGILHVHRVPFTLKDGVYKFSEHTTQTEYLPSLARSLSFSSTLLVVSKTSCRIFAPTCLLTLSPGKPIIDAKWIQSGKAIIALLADGEWGIWDLEPSSKGLLGHSIRGGAYTPFTTSGWLEGPPTKTRAASKFTPMTPSTRRTADVLFGGRHASSGQISVCTLPKSSAATGSDESIAFWLDDAFALIPSLRSFYEAQNKRGGALFGGSGARHMRLEGVSLLGERCTGIAHGAPSSASSSIPTEIIIAGEHRLVVLTGAEGLEPATRRALGPVENRSLTLGALDVEEIDEVLARMENGSPQGRRKIKFVE